MHKQRLLKLARHLESGNLGHKRFDFSEINSVRAPRCGASGCAIGELPVLFPDEWEFSSNGLPFLKEQTTGNPIRDSQVFFEIGWDVSSHLFVPDSQNIYEYGGKELNDNATPTEVARNIRAFLKYFGKETRK